MALSSICQPFIVILNKKKFIQDEKIGEKL